jgi:putative acetyltransferase
MNDVPQSRLREATGVEADHLALLERSANLQALAHIFPPAQYPYPTDEVRDRWRQLLQDPSVHVGVAEDDSGLAAFVAFDDEVLRHLAVRPDLWGSGLARSAVNWARERVSLQRLWCLERNSRALGFYTRLGWTPTGRRRRAEFAPYPAEVELHFVSESST